MYEVQLSTIAAECVEKQLKTIYVHGCNKLEMPEFKGLQECKHITKTQNYLKEFSGTQEKLKI